MNNTENGNDCKQSVTNQKQLKNLKLASYTPNCSTLSTFSQYPKSPQLKQFRRLYKQKKLTECLELIEQKSGFKSDIILDFLMTELRGAS